MPELSISSDFTVDDIHKVREYNYEITKDMSTQERRNYYKIGADIVQKRIEELRRIKRAQQ